MKRLAWALLAAATAASPGLPAPSTPTVRACDVKLNVTDPDPAGLNVRDAPGGRVIGSLKAKNRWVQVHVTGDAGGWMRIDGATLYDDTLPDGEKPVFSRTGFVAVSRLGVESLNGNARILAAPRDGARLLLTAPLDPDKAPKAEVLGCDGAFIEVRAAGVTGWTTGFCSNQYTTCV